jgi:hypothetical protein
MRGRLRARHAARPRGSRPRGKTMRVLPVMIGSAVALCMLMSAAEARRSCSRNIDIMQAHIDARIEAIAAAGPFVRPGLAAGLGVQPTPLGIATVEERMGEISRNKMGTIRDAMARARAANAAGNSRACGQALAEVARQLRH